MNEEGQLDRIELATAAGMKPGTFWRELLEYNDHARRNGLPELKPDSIEQHKSYRKYFFKPERAAEFKAALDQLLHRPTSKKAV